MNMAISRAFLWFGWITYYRQNLPHAAKDLSSKCIQATKTAPIGSSSLHLVAGLFCKVRKASRRGTKKQIYLAILDGQA